MASADERPDLEAFRELEEVLRHLADELASWRRRALSAEARLVEEWPVSGPGERAPARVGQLEVEPRGLEQRLAMARSRVAELVARLKFLEQQAKGRAEPS